MITRLEIKNFKSLVDFQIPPDGKSLGAFTCLVGLNGSGKSTLLQAFDFIAHVATGKVAEWLKERDWKESELASAVEKTKSKIIKITLDVETKNLGHIRWYALFSTKQLKCIIERFSLIKNEKEKKEIFVIRNRKIYTSINNNDTKKKNESRPIAFKYKGSILSVLDIEHLEVKETKDILTSIKDTLEGLRSVELLAPNTMRRRTREASDIGVGGEKLSAFLNGLKKDKKESLLTKLKNFYPQLTDFKTPILRGGWKNLEISETYGNSRKEKSDMAISIQTKATHINDGMLRIIAILAQAQGSHDFLLFDEIENGISPFIIEKLMDFLVGLKKEGKQIIVTTHNPMILNYLEDEIAKEATVLLYKNKDGHTLACRYFDQPETKDKLHGLGPGEVFVDTDLIKMTKRLQSQSPKTKPEDEQQ
jgi:predicted ATPase